MTTVLTAHDRCEGKECGAQAFVRVMKAMMIKNEPSFGYLDFCAHHYVKNEAALDIDGWDVHVDNRELINAAPSPSANAIAD